MSSAPEPQSIRPASPLLKTGSLTGFEKNAMLERIMREQLRLMSEQLAVINAQESTTSSGPGLKNESAPTDSTPIAPTVARRDRLTAQLRSAIKDISGLEVADDKLSFMEMGFDSLVLTQASQEFYRLFGVRITFRRLINDLSTIADLARHIDDTLAPETQPVSSVVILPDNAIQPFLLQQKAAAHLQLPFLVAASGEASISPPPPTTKLNPPLTLSSSAPASDRVQNNAFGPGVISKQAVESELSVPQREHLSGLIERYTRKTRRSKELTQKYRQWYADPRTASGFNRQWKEMCYQIVVDSSKGSRLHDIDGNEYIDLLNGFGPNFIGHSADFITAALTKQLANGIEVGPQSPIAGEAAKLFCELTGNERASFVNTGSEAVYAAMRLARTVTGRDKIVVFNRDYHGNFDEVLVRGLGATADFRTVPSAPGIPRRAVQDMYVLEYGTDEALAFIEQHAEEIAAILVEPVQSRRPEFQPHAFIKAARQLTEQKGIVFIFDEVITGLRDGLQGAQAIYGIKADLATYGKVVGGGMPIGVVAGRAQFMDTFDGGMWQYGDSSGPEKGVTFFAGTFVRHPMAMAAVLAMLKHLQGLKPSFWNDINARAHRFATTIDSFFVERGIPIRMPHFCSQMYLRVPDDLKYGNLLFFHLREQGIFLLEHFPFYLTAAHTDEDIDHMIKVIKESTLALQAVGFLPGANDNDSHATTVAPTELASPTTTASANIPLTEAQREIWLATQMGRVASCAFIETCSLHFSGELDQPALQRALDTVIQRHDSLRAVFSPAGDGQTILPELRVEIALRDFTSQPKAEREAAVTAILAEQGLHEFNLAQGPMLLCQLLRLQPQEHLFVFTAHHLACDGWSYDVVVTELSRLYSAYKNGTKPTLDAVTSYGEFAAWEKQQQASAEGRAAEVWWKNRFSVLPESLELPTDRPRPRERSFNGARLCHTLPEALSSAVRQAASRQNTTLHSFLLAAFHVLLHRLSGQTDLIVGIPVAGQNTMNRGCLVGHCANLLPLRVTIHPELRFTEFLRTVKENALDAFEQQTMTFGALVRNLNPPRNPSRSPLVSVMFNVDPPLDSLCFDGLEHEINLNPRRCYQFDLGINLVTEKKTQVVECDYNPDLFDAGTIKRWLGHYETLLKAATVSPETPVDQLPLLNEQQQRSLLVEWNQTESSYPRQTLHALIAAKAKHYSTRIAVECDQVQLTYGELTARANQLAHHLRALGVGADTLVAVCVERSIDMVVGVLAVLQAGGAYIPIDPEFPEDRIATMLEDAAAPVMLTQTTVLRRLPSTSAQIFCFDRDWATVESLPTTTIEEVAGPDNLAYVIYTSGSTGRPKGVEISHRAVVNFLESMRREPGLTPEDVLLAVTTLSFDIAGLELFLPLTTGARLVIVSRAIATDPHQLAPLMAAHNVTVMQATPSTWRMLVESGWNGRPQLKILCGGEAMPSDLAESLLVRCGELWNMYGPTETTIWSTIKRLQPGNPITIGRPIANTRLYVVDSKLKPVPIGIAGELLIGGDGVARGYRQRPELTNEKFLIDPFRHDGSKAYRTGDLARWTPQGEIECLGRIDFQVKIRGHRIELGEIESALLAIPGVKQAVAALQPAANGAPELAAFVVKSKEPSMELWMASPSVGKHQLYDDLMYEIMSSDEARNQCFLAAFKRTLHGKVLLDIGTGKDAILARLAIEAGARKVYAIEILETPYRQALALVQKLGLQDRIEVLLGDASTVVLPEKVDSCVAEIIGNIGGAEGLERLLGMCRNQVKAQGTVIPARVLTRIAAVQLPTDFRVNPTFAPLAGDYVKQVFEVAGRRFDLRLSLSGTTEQHLRSSDAIFEECDFTTSTSSTYNRPITLRITQDSLLDGFLLWLEIQMTPEDVFIGLNNQKSWLPVFFPVFDPPLQVGAGDVIEAIATGKEATNGWNKDYNLEGRLIRTTGEAVPFQFTTKHDAGTYQGTPFYKRLFAGDAIPVNEREERALTAASLRDALRKKLPEYMVPSGFAFLEKLPLTPNGKIDRKALPAVEARADTLREAIAPRNPTEERMTAIFTKVLAPHPVTSVTDSFFDLGGHSMLAVKLVALIEQDFGARVPLAKLLAAPTIEQLSLYLDQHNPSEKTWSSLVPLRPQPGKPTIFLIHGAGGNVLLYRELANAIGPGFSVYGFQSQGLDRHSRFLRTIEEMAAHYVRELRAFQPKGPYHLGGYCMGGTVAYEMAQRLQDAGEEVALVAMLDTYNFSRALKSNFYGLVLEKFNFHCANFFRLKPREMWSYLTEKIRVARDGEFASILTSKPDLTKAPELDHATSDLEASLQTLNDRAAEAYQPRHYPGRLTLFKPQANYKFYPDPNMGWGDLVGGGLEIVEFPFKPHAMLVEPYVKQLANALKQCMKESAKKER